MKVIAQNKKVLFNYEVLEKFQAGIVLNGQEVKSIRGGRMNLSGSFVVMKNEEAWILGAHIPAYQPKNAPSDYSPERTRKLLLTKKEIKYLMGKNQQKGLTIVPLAVYNAKDRIKVEIALVKPKKKFDKREKIIKRETTREIERKMKSSL